MSSLDYRGPGEIPELIRERMRADRADAERDAARERAASLEAAMFKALQERDAARAELAGWLATHPPSLCSAHQVLDLSCRMCNPALRDLARVAAVHPSCPAFDDQPGPCNCVKPRDLAASQARERGMLTRVAEAVREADARDVMHWLAQHHRPVFSKDLAAIIECVDLAAIVAGVKP